MSTHIRSSMSRRNMEQHMGGWYLSHSFVLVNPYKIASKYDQGHREKETEH